MSGSGEAAPNDNGGSPARLATLDGQLTQLYRVTALLALLSVMAVGVAVEYRAPSWYTVLLPLLLAATLVGMSRRRAERHRLLDHMHRRPTPAPPVESTSHSVATR